jgi:signal transduction histidine kinase/CheY-like chemotaxis protein/PAS domain-containing protein
LGEGEPTTTPQGTSRWESLDDPEQRARDVFTPIVRATLIIGAVGLLFITPFIAINKAGSAALSIVVFLAAAVSWFCMRRNRARTGAIIIVATFWTVQTLLIALSNGGFIGSAYVFTTLLAGLALGTRAAWIVGGLGILVLTVTMALSILHIQLPVVFPAPYPARASFAIAVLLGALWALYVFIRRMESAFSTAAHELSERKRTEEQVQRRAADFEEAQRLAQSGSWEYDVASGVHRWSRQHFRIHGLDPDTTPASFRAFIERVPPEEQDIVAAAFRSAYDPPYYISGEYRIQRAPNDLRTIDGRIEGVLDEHGKVVKLRGTSVDITERRRTEELRELELEVARCLAGAEEMEPAILAALGAICEHERWEVGGYWSADEKAGELVLEHWWVRPGFAEAAKPLIEDGKRNSYGSGVGLVGYAWRTGSALWIPDVTKDERVSRVKLLNASGLRSAALMPVTDGSRVVGVLVFSGLEVREPDHPFLQAFPVLGSLVGQFVQRRQTEHQRRALQAQLYQAQKLQALGTLAGGIAHEFNNMIAAIIGNASLAIQDVGANPAARESLDQITAAAERARALTRRILLFGRAQSDTRKSTALAPVIEDVMRLLRATLPARITLSLSQSANVPTVRADATQLHQLIINLCTNAAHAIGNEAGSIGISLAVAPSGPGSFPGLREAKPGEFVCLSVTDTGCGIDPQVRDRIFEPFFTTKRVGEGAGLGLSVVHSIVQGHEGAIELESTPGQGTTFRVYLPAETGTDAQLARPESAPADHRAGSHVVYIDDDPTIVSAMERLLTRRGYRVNGFTSPRKALDFLRESSQLPSLLVTDYNMAEMSGLDVARQSAELYATLPVLIVSGFIDERVERTGRALSVREFVHKPDLQEMCAAIDRLCGLTPPE